MEAYDDRPLYQRNDLPGHTTRHQRRTVPWLAGGAAAIALALLALWRTEDGAPSPSATEIEVARSSPPKPAEPPADPPGAREKPEPEVSFDFRLE